MREVEATAWKPGGKLVYQSTVPDVPGLWPVPGPGLHLRIVGEIRTPLIVR